MLHQLHQRHRCSVCPRNLQLAWRCLLSPMRHRILRGIHRSDQRCLQWPVPRWRVRCDARTKYDCLQRSLLTRVRVSFRQHHRHRESVSDRDVQRSWRWQLYGLCCRQVWSRQRYDNIVVCRQLCCRALLCARVDQRHSRRLWAWYLQHQWCSCLCRLCGWAVRVHVGPALPCLHRALPTRPIRVPGTCAGRQLHGCMLAWVRLSSRVHQRHRGCVSCWVIQRGGHGQLQPLPRRPVWGDRSVEHPILHGGVQCGVRRSAWVHQPHGCCLRPR